MIVFAVGASKGWPAALRPTRVTTTSGLGVVSTIRIVMLPLPSVVTVASSVCCTSLSPCVASVSTLRTHTAVGVTAGTNAAIEVPMAAVTAAKAIKAITRVLRFIIVLI